MNVSTMPLRVDVVNATCGAHPEVFQGPIETSDDRRRAFLPTIVRALNALDGGLWGMLLKSDQAGKVPADIVVWRPTMEHVDVMSDAGAIWNYKGVVTNPAWLWLAVDPIVDAPPPPPPPPPPADDAALLLAFAALDRQLAELRAEMRDGIQQLLARPSAVGAQGGTVRWVVELALRPDDRPAGV